VLRHRLSLAAVIAAVAVAGCGDDNDDSGNSPERAETPSAQACPPEAAQAQEDAAFMMKSDDFDGALATIKPFLDCPEVKQLETEYRATAAKTTLKIARKRLEEARKSNSEEDSPQPAVSLARNSLRYKETAEAREFLAEAEAELATFKEKYGPKPDEEAGGPPPGAGDGGPPEGKGE
jgi:hypothetical protein